MSPFSPPSHRCHYSDIDPTCRVAHLGDRLIAAATDHLVVFGMCAVVTVWSFTRWSFVGPSEFQLTTASLLIAGMLSEACAFLYLWLFEAAFEASLGKMIVGLGPLAACAIRNALRLIEAGTAVVEETFPAGVKALAILVWTAAMATSVWALPRIWVKPLPSNPPRNLGNTVLQIGSAPGSAYIRPARWRLDLQFAPDRPPKSDMKRGRPRLMALAAFPICHFEDA